MTATFEPKYGASAALTVTGLQSLASDTNLLAGWASAVIDNTANLSLDELVAGTLKSNSAPTAGKTAEIWVWAILDDTPTYPDTITGSEGTVTLSSINIKNASMRLGALIVFDASATKVFPFTPFSVADLFGSMPKKWGIFIVHNAGVALNASGNAVYRTPVQGQSV